MKRIKNVLIFFLAMVMLGACRDKKSEKKEEENIQQENTFVNPLKTEGAQCWANYYKNSSTVFYEQGKPSSFHLIIHFHSSYSSPRSMIRSVIDPFGFTIGITSSSFSMINSMIVGPSVFAFAFSNAGIISSFLKTLIPCAP